MTLVPRLPAVLRRPWERTNHAGRAVTLLEGPVVAAAAGSGLVSAAVLGHRGTAPAVLATAGAAVAGAIDDLSGSAASKGLRGHLGALGRGQLTTGALKIAGLASTGIASVWLADRPSGRPTADAVTGGLAVAGCANVANLFDLRPGRALKVVTAVALPVLLIRRSPPSAAALGAALGAAPADLRGTAMLGDTGANTLGALVGFGLVEGTSRRTRLAVLAVATGLTLASERVSFTAVIASNPLLRRIDEWGRRGS